MQIKYKIARLDIIAAQVANQVFTLKNALNYIQNDKAKRLKQLKIIATIKNNNLQMVVTIAKK